MSERFSELRNRVCAANRSLGTTGLAPLTWGNASGADRVARVFAIKPSGVSYESLRPDQIVILSLADGSVIEGELKASSDTATHLEIYQAFPNVNGIVHTHSRCATVWAQACKAIPCLGTTHADHFAGPIPVTRELSPSEVESGYVTNTGKAIVEAFSERDPDAIPAVLLPHHGPFVWGATVEKALENAIALEHVAEMALYTLALNPDVQMPESLRRFHFQRKHGTDATYGQ